MKRKDSTIPTDDHAHNAHTPSEKRPAPM
jgi:hypothetical protein